MLRGETVALLPDADVVVDVDVFEALADAALVASPGDAAAAAAAYTGPLLPGTSTSRGPNGAGAPEAALHRPASASRPWDRVLAEDPTDELANLVLMNGHVANGDLRAALRQFERLDAALRRELGVTPSPR